MAQSDDEPLDAGGFIQRIGWFEAANGFPHGVFEILAAFVIALILGPVARRHVVVDDRHDAGHDPG